VLAFTSEEIWQGLKNKGVKDLSVHMTEWPEVKGEYLNLEIKERYAKIIGLRDGVLKLLEGLRNNKTIGHPYEAKAILNIANEDDFQFFKKYERAD
jgi:isoleucyl-tRNA synthetase